MEELLEKQHHLQNIAKELLMKIAYAKKMGNDASDLEEMLSDTKREIMELQMQISIYGMSIEKENGGIKK